MLLSASSVSMIYDVCLWRFVRWWPDQKPEDSLRMRDDLAVETSRQDDQPASRLLETENVVFIVSGVGSAGRGLLRWASSLMVPVALRTSRLWTSRKLVPSVRSDMWTPRHTHNHPSFRRGWSFYLNPLPIRSSVHGWGGGWSFKFLWWSNYGVSQFGCYSEGFRAVLGLAFGDGDLGLAILGRSRITTRLAFDRDKDAVMFHRYVGKLKRKEVFGLGIGLGLVNFRVSLKQQL